MCRKSENRCDQIKAYFRREERYEGFQLVFKEHPELKDEILEAIEEAKKETGVDPVVFENRSTKESDPDAFYIEFNDDYDKDGGDFFEIVLKKLGIDRCEQ